MKIRTKLTLLFFFLMAIIMSVAFVSIYYQSENYRQTDFIRRLKNRAANTAKVLTQIKEVNAALLKRMEKNNPASLPDQHISIFDDRHLEVYQSDGPSPLTIDKELLQSIKSKGDILMQIDRYEIVGFTVQTGQENLTVVGSAMDVYGREAIDNLRTTLLLTFGVSLFAISLLGWYLSGKVLKPIANIVNEVSRISEANLDLRLHEGDEKDELSQLAETFNRMLARLQSAFSSQRSFIANASHELRTPITIMTSEIEVTLLNDRDTTYYRESLHSVLKTLKRMNDLSTRLLMLAHSSAEVTNRTFMPVRIDDVLWEAKQRLASLNPEFVVDVSFAVNINDEALLVNCDEQLMGIALVNLMDNGCKYSPDHRVIVQLTTSHKDKITISFINAGKHIGEDETEMLFQPFFRRSSDKSKKGFGIGLSLIGSIINLHNGQIKVLSEDGMINFVVTLPNSRPQQDIVHV